MPLLGALRNLPVSSRVLRHLELGANHIRDPLGFRRFDRVVQVRFVPSAAAGAQVPPHPVPPLVEQDAAAPTRAWARVHDGFVRAAVGGQPSVGRYRVPDERVAAVLTRLLRRFVARLVKTFLKERSVLLLVSGHVRRTSCGRI